jgi:cytoplasmic iron level regulating protein YaaA (DUF328/UPF0246 family)
MEHIAGQLPYNAHNACCIAVRTIKLLMAPATLILLPPSESKTPGGSLLSPSDVFSETLGESRRSVITALDKFLHQSSNESRQRLLGVRGTLLTQAVRDSKDIVAGHARTLPAWRRYKGVVWTHLDPSTLSPAQRSCLLIPSGLYGLSTGEDPIANYRLRMSVTLFPLGKLSVYWQQAITDALCVHSTNAVVINLLPREHTSAFDIQRVGQHTELINVNFVTSDGSRASGHGAKAAKGMLARAISVEGPKVLDTFDWGGWSTLRQGNAVQVLAPTAH